MEPQFSVNGMPLGMPGAIGFFAMVAMLWGFFVMLFWMVCAWRAMRAHERLADAAEKLAPNKNNGAENKETPPTQ